MSLDLRGRAAGGPMGEEFRLWEDFSFVASSTYRERVLAALASQPKLPKQLTRETNLRMGHVSRALREMRKRGLVELLTPAAKARGRLYGVTDAGSTLLSYLRDSRRRFLPPVATGPGYFGFVPKVRGSSILGFLSHLRKAKDAGDVAAVLRGWSVNPDDVTEDGWLPIDACADLLELVESKFGDGSYGFIRSLFSEVGPQFPTIREQLLRAVPLELLAETAPIVYNKEWNFGRVVVKTERRRATFAHYDWMPTPAMCAMFHGVYEGVLKTRRYPGKVTKTRCVREGDDRCEYVVEW